MNYKYLEEDCFKLYCLYILFFYVKVYDVSGYFQKYACIRKDIPAVAGC
jgi:hypothetical protein